MRLFFRSVAALVTLLLIADAAQAGLFARRVAAPGARACAPGTACGRQQAQAYAQPRAQAPQVQAQFASYQGDAAGFAAWLNGVRAQYRLGPVAVDAGLCQDALVNSQQQAAHGLGHFFMGRARRQNSAEGGHDLGNRWMDSPAHRAALLDPSIRMIGLAGYGAYWTFSAN